MVMDFFKNKVKKYQEQSTKNELEEQLNNLKSSNEKLIKDISYHGKMVDIWIANEKKLRKQMNDS
ncbi:hypothetical protein OAR84_03150 [Nitrosopumilus sp.]|nr:hypothetical protein [Nitrosopumilus sp.]